MKIYNKGQAKIIGSNFELLPNETKEIDDLEANKLLQMYSFLEPLTISVLEKKENSDFYSMNRKELIEFIVNEKLNVDVKGMKLNEIRQAVLKKMSE